MKIKSTVSHFSAERVYETLLGLPEAEYLVLVKPLRYRIHPRLSAWTEWDTRTITLQLPEPFLPFGEVVSYAAKRRPGRELRFVWFSEGVTFRRPREVLRFLYLHEWLHWYLRERLGRKGAAETACERFALRNYLKEQVTEADAAWALQVRGAAAFSSPGEE